MIYQVRILASALEDIKIYYQYIARESPENAIKWFNEISDSIQSLETMPKRCAVAPETTIVGMEIRVLVYRKNYRILFCVEQETVRIYHIQHSSQDYLAKDKFLMQPANTTEET